MRLIFKDKYLRIVFGLSFLIVVFSSALTVFKLKGISSPLIIHFDSYSGINFLGGWQEVLKILILALAMIVINAFLAGFLYSRERFLSYIFAFGSLTLAILILIAISVIISVN